MEDIKNNTIEETTTEAIETSANEAKQTMFKTSIVVSIISTVISMILGIVEIHYRRKGMTVREIKALPIYKSLWGASTGLALYGLMLHLGATYYEKIRLAISKVKSFFSKLVHKILG